MLLPAINTSLSISFLLLMAITLLLTEANAKPFRIPMPKNPVGFPMRKFSHHSSQETPRNDVRFLQNGTSTASSTSTTSSENFSCSNDPFLWLIKKDDKVQGFGVGTMHVKRELVVTDAQWESLTNAVDDACTVYGEYDTTQPGAAEEIAETCLPENPVYLTDVPDPELREAYRDKLLEITTEYAPQSSQQVVDRLASRVPLESLQIIIVAWNTPEMRDWYLQQAFQPGTNGAAEDFMDNDLMEMGSPSASLETLEESCTYLEEIAIDKQHFLNNFEQVYEEAMWEVLELSDSGLFDAYKCGSSEAVVQYIDEGMATGTDVMLVEDTMEALLDDRNINMVERMVGTMSRPNATLPLFAVGLAHWIYGDNSLQILLENQGYTLERVEGSYDSLALPDAVCKSSASDASTTMIQVLVLGSATTCMAVLSTVLF